MARISFLRSSLLAMAAVLLVIGQAGSIAAQTSKQPSTQGTEQPAGHGPDARNTGATEPDSQPATTGAATKTEIGGNINDNSYYATGSDLNGPAVRFLPASKTPE